jgi:class 3 adenylate cyclase
MIPRNVGPDEVRKLSATPDSTLADPEQRIADLERQLAECRAERDEALEQQIAITEVLRVISSSPGNLAPVFDAILAQAMRLCDSGFGICSMFEDECFIQVAQRGIPAELWDVFPRRYRGSPGGSLERLIGGEAVVHVADLADSAPYLSGNPGRVPLVDIGGARTAVLVALRREQTLFGCLGFYRREVRPFSDRQIALLQNFAAQAVIAMDNARLLTETREALEQQTATAEVLQVINSSPGDLVPVFDAILEKAHALCGAPLGSLVVYNGEQLRAVATRGYPQEYDAMARQGFSPLSVSDRLLKGEPFVQVADPAAPEAPDENHPLRRAAVAIAGIRTALFVPLRKDAKVLGYISAQRQEVRPFSDEQIALLQNFAAQAVVAMENARLINETREALEQQTATAEVLQVINSSPGDLAPVFEAVLERAHSLCDATIGSLALFDGTVFRAVAVHGTSGPFADQLRQGIGVRDAPTIEPLLAGAPFVHVNDLRMLGDRFSQAAAEQNPARTILWVPLRKDGELLGFIVAARDEVRPFTGKQIALLQSFAAQAVIAMENARLLGELRQRTEEVAELNRDLEARVAEQVEELGRVGRLKRFLAPQLAELIVSQGDEKILESHRREIVVVFCDLRGYTAFTETAEPEEVLDFLRDYHGALGPLVSQFEGTLDQFSGDGIMVFFNDPVPIPDPAERAVNMAVAMREAAGTLIADWRERGRDLGFGAGIAQGYATLGQIGFSERAGYTAIGTVCNVAARLCAEAKDGQILLSQRVNVALKGSITTEQLGALALKGLTQPVVAYNVPLVGSQAAFRVIEGGAPSA